ncbi:Ser/Thr protein kinase RdoA involved in Cpx stress response, MazF antagonist [Paenibacillus sp. 1_12]|uniref:phosphotransferase enzyme family protein n=1 Tax=Paenibacillus sp. 1_12 TaxID=1566278 RepID=UPI0008E219B0|nr:phosphotransferase [Paenibacillus sp. 1_12]SFL80378.1 Ser/Thr protein kinase RdoA involved in Cpx stress response, MazF antagonist [Paenibacillus sp. 1_12]
MQSINIQIDESLVSEAGSRFADKSTLFIPMESFESSVYAWANRGKRYVLKMIDRQRRSEAEIQGEIDFVHFAVDHGVSAAKAIASHNGSYVESVDIPVGGGVWAYAFEWAEGELCSPENWGPELFIEWGQLTGKLHQISMQYKPTRPEWKRCRWDEDELYADALWRVAVEPKFEASLGIFLSKLQQIPEQQGQFGLIHNDLHHRNFHVNAGKLTAFDFDGMLYHHFASDIAVALYYGLSTDRSTNNKLSFAQLFMDHFMEGYTRNQSVSKELLAYVPEWMLLRHLQLYTLYLRKWSGPNLNTMQRWTLNRYRTDLLEGKLFGGIDLCKVRLLLQ